MTHRFRKLEVERLPSGARCEAVAARARCCLVGGRVELTKPRSYRCLRTPYSWMSRLGHVLSSDSATQPGEKPWKVEEEPSAVRAMALWVRLMLSDADTAGCDGDDSFQGGNFAALERERFRSFADRGEQSGNLRLAESPCSLGMMWHCCARRKLGRAGKRAHLACSAYKAKAEEDSERSLRKPRAFLGLVRPRCLEVRKVNQGWASNQLCTTTTEHPPPQPSEASNGMLRLRAWHVENGLDDDRRNCGFDHRDGCCTQKALLRVDKVNQPAPLVDRVEHD